MGYSRQPPACPIEQLISEYESGMTGRDLAKKYGVSFQAIYSRLWNAGIVPHKHRARGGWRGNRVDLPVSDLVRHYEAGESLADLKERYGVAIETIARRLRKAGVKLRSIPRKASDEQLRADYESGMTITEVAKKRGISFHSAWRHLSRMGIIRSYGHKLRKKEASHGAG